MRLGAKIREIATGCHHRKAEVVRTAALKDVGRKRHHLIRDQASAHGSPSGELRTDEHEKNHSARLDDLTGWCVLIMVQALC